MGEVDFGTGIFLIESVGLNQHGKCKRKMRKRNPRLAFSKSESYTIGSHGTEPRAMATAIGRKATAEDR
jgi:hypothetical protein